MLEMRGIALRYGPVVALDGVDLSVDAGQVHALLGENGAGKSSLMQVLVGAVRPDAGAMYLDGQDYTPQTTTGALELGIAMVFQELLVLPHLTVAENLWLGRERTRGLFVDRRARRLDAERVLLRLGREDLAPDARVGDLSPGDRQIVEIARALLADARILVLDEPTSSLGADDVEHLFAVIGQLRAEGLGIVYISHSLEEVRTVCDHCTVLRDGRTVKTGPLHELDDQALVAHMAGRPLDEVFPARQRRAAAVVLEVEDVRGEPLPRHASFALRGGEIAGIAGLAGAGRSELLQTLFGTRRRRSGQVALHGEPLPADPGRCWQLGVGMLAEDRKNEGLSVRLPIATNMVLPRVDAHVRGGMLVWSSVRDAARSLGERVQLRSREPMQAVGELSGGNQQKVAIARLLHAECSVLLLDEPTRGIDVGSRHEVYRLLDRAAAAGAAVLVVSSHLPELLGLCDRIAVMHRGQLGSFRHTEEWTQESLLREMMLGVGAEAKT
ncbi:MAG: sugar ABC transporter ATP-binding protein [Planctomycetes bacterium]|nr:sugar ABC transporter ATP-binding protein [Planctomycetota bacterium]